MRISLRPTVRRLTQQSKLLAGIAAGLVVGGAASAVVIASIPDANGVIHGCYRTNNGTLRIIDDATETCAGNETAISWNQQGPAGGAGSFLNNWAGLNLGSADLRNRNFAGVDMNGTNLVEANLSFSDFSGANLMAGQIGGQAWSTNFSGANFSQALVHTLIAEGADFQGANFSGATLINGIRGGDFQGATFAGATIGQPVASIKFEGVSFSGLDFTSVVFVQDETTYIFDSSALVGVNFSGHNLTFFTIRHSDISNANFSNAEFTDSAFTNLTAEGANFSNTTFANVSFRDTNLSTTNLSGVVWENVICPNGTNSDNNSNTCVGHLEP